MQSLPLTPIFLFEELISPSQIKFHRHNQFPYWLFHCDEQYSPKNFFFFFFFFFFGNLFLAALGVILCARHQKRTHAGGQLSI